MKKIVIILGALFILIIALLVAIFVGVNNDRSSNPSQETDSDNTENFAEATDKIDSEKSDNPRLIFIHHSTGENWLADDNGGLGKALMDNGYIVSDTNYGWGPDSIGDNTDIGHFWTWFRGPNSENYLEAIYLGFEQSSEYTRIESITNDENEIVMFKSCFPNSNLSGTENDPIPAINQNPLRGESSDSEYHTLSNAKGIYLDLLEYFKTRQDKLFIIITPPPLGANNTDETAANNARALSDWMENDLINQYQYNNVAVFNFFDVLTNFGQSNYLEFFDDEWDDHPSSAGNKVATVAFITFINQSYSEFID